MFYEPCSSLKHIVIGSQLKMLFFRWYKTNCTFAQTSNPLAYICKDNARGSGRFWAIPLRATVEKFQQSECNGWPERVTVPPQNASHLDQTLSHRRHCNRGTNYRTQHRLVSMHPYFSRAYLGHGIAHHCPSGFTLSYLNILPILVHAGRSLRCGALCI